MSKDPSTDKTLKQKREAERAAKLKKKAKRATAKLKNTAEVSNNSSSHTGDIEFDCWEDLTGIRIECTKTIAEFVKIAQYGITGITSAKDVRPGDYEEVMTTARAIIEDAKEFTAKAAELFADVPTSGKVTPDELPDYIALGSTVSELLVDVTNAMGANATFITDKVLSYIGDK